MYLFYLTLHTLLVKLGKILAGVVEEKWQNLYSVCVQRCLQLTLWWSNLAPSNQEVSGNITRNRINQPHGPPDRRTQYCF